MNISDELIDDIVKVISSKCECKLISTDDNKSVLACENCRILDRIVQEKSEEQESYLDSVLLM
jgi:hypothetical protein